MKDYGTEHVLVCDADLADVLIHSHRGWATILSILGKLSRYCLRNDVENDESLVQLIPYNLLRYDDGENYRFFSYMRGCASGERRLVGSGSIGIGGHCDRCDTAGSLPVTLINCAKREILEEVGIHAENPSFLGFIRETDSAVGRVHLGVGFLWDMYHMDVMQDSEQRYIAKGTAESQIKSGEFITMSEIASRDARGDYYEAWSRILMQLYITSLHFFSNAKWIASSSSLSTGLELYQTKQDRTIHRKDEESRCQTRYGGR